MPRIWKLVIMIAAIIIVDQITKYVVLYNMYPGESIEIIPYIFNFTFVKNTGAAFGMGADFHESIRKPLFLFIPVLACFWLMWLIWRTRKSLIIDSLAYSLILAGAIGNLLDRFILGYVIDFLDFHWGNAHFPAFNVADSSITIAAFLLIISFYIHAKHAKTTKINDSNDDVPE